MVHVDFATGDIRDSDISAMALTATPDGQVFAVTAGIPVKVVQLGDTPRELVHLPDGATGMLAIAGKTVYVGRADNGGVNVLGAMTLVRRNPVSLSPEGPPPVSVEDAAMSADGVLWTSVAGLVTGHGENDDRASGVRLVPAVDGRTTRSMQS